MLVMLRFSSLLRKTPLKSKRGINYISEKRLQTLNAEVPIIIALCKRCSGKPFIRSITIRTHVGKGSIVNKQLLQVTCLGGVCEVCNKPAGGKILDKHHKIPLSHGGKTTLDNCYMAHRSCHMMLHGIKVVQSKPLWGLNNV